jgi:hypothetical protein
MELSNKEQKTIQALLQLAENWPDTLWLFAASGNLHVMRRGAGGEMVTLTPGGFNPRYIVASVSIPCDGGDW